MPRISHILCLAGMLSVITLLPKVSVADGKIKLNYNMVAVSCEVRYGSVYETVDLDRKERGDLKRIICAESVKYIQSLLPWNVQVFEINSMFDLSSYSSCLGVAVLITLRDIEGCDIYDQNFLFVTMHKYLSQKNNNCFNMKTSYPEIIYCDNYKMLFDKKSCCFKNLQKVLQEKINKLIVTDEYAGCD